MSKQVFTVILLSLLWMKLASANIDAMTLALQEPYQNKQSIHWDNIKSSPFWLKGINPEYHSPWQMHRILLKPGQQSSFFLPAYESLRLYNPEKSIQASDISVLMSNGTGLLTEVDLQTSTDKNSLIISSQSGKSQVVYIDHSGKKKEDIEIAIFISRRDQLKNPAPYRDLKWLPGKWVGLSQSPLQIPEIYWQIQAYQKEWINIEGPARIVLKNRLRYEKQATSLFQQYRIRYRLNGSESVWLNLATSAESSRHLYVNTFKETLGREQQAYIEIPAGHHRLELMSDRNLYLRILQQSENDYLFPQLNQPPLSIKEVRIQGLMAEQNLPKTNALVQNIIRDNQRQSSAVAAAHLLKQSALQRRDYPKGLAEADKVMGQYTFYRNLLPTHKQSAFPQFKAYFINKRLRAIRRPQYDALLSKQHQDAALNRLRDATFSPLISNSDVDSYLLKPRSTPTLLRLIADKRQCLNRRFKIQMDQRPAKIFILNCQFELNSEDAFVRSISETALMEMQQQETANNETLSDLFAVHNRPEKLIPVAINEIVLPAQVQQIKVWSDDGEPRPINLALQIRSSKSYQFSEQSYLALLHELPKTQLLKLFTSDFEQTQEQGSDTQRQLQNQWIPLKRYLSGLYRHYKSSVAKQMSLKFLAKQADLENKQKLARQAEQQQQWIEAISHWTSIIEASQGQIRDQAQLAQADNLAKLSENYLALSLWRYLTLYGHNNVAEQAKNRLLSDYQQQQDDYSIQMLAATLFMHQPNHKNLHFLIENLMQNKQFRFALILSQLVPEPPTLLMIKAAYQLQWWQTFEQLLTQLPQTQQAFWRGLKAQKQGDYQTALNVWKHSETQNWRLHLQQGIKLAKRLSNKSTKEPDKKQLFIDWSKWQQTHPGERLWNDASTYVKDAVGTDKYYSIERDLHQRLFRGNPQRPVKIEVLGPVKLNFKIKILHQQADSRLNGWIKIKDNLNYLRYPYINNKVVEGLTLTSDDDYLPGNWVTMEYQVGQGLHEIELSSDDAPISVSISESQPELPLTILAHLQLDSFHYALNPNLLSNNHIKQLIEVKPSSSIAIPEKKLTLQELLDLPEVKNSNQAESRMMQCLSLLEHENSTALQFVAEQIQQKFAFNQMVQNLWNRISSYSEWQTVNSMVSNAGMRFIETHSWHPASPALAIRKALISKTNTGEHVVLANNRLLMMMTNLSTKNVTIEALLDDLDFLPDSPSQLKYQIDDQAPKQFAISRTDDWKKFQIEIPTGNHQIRFWLAEAVSNQFLKLRFHAENADMNVAKERAFFVSTQNDPLKLYIKGPAMIRINEWLNNKITSRDLEVSPDWQLLTIPPQGQQQESLLQIKQRNITLEAKPIIARSIKRKLEAVEPLTIQFKKMPNPKPVVIKDYYKLTDQVFSTWSIGTQLNRRNNIQEDAAQGEPEHFQQFHIGHRYYDEFNRSYWNTQSFFRLRENGNPSFGLNESVTFLPDSLPFAINLKAKTIAQVVEGDPEWLGQFNIALSQSAHITPKTTIIPKLSWTARYMSLRDNDKVIKDGGFKKLGLSSEVDQDLYTAFKAQHTTGLNASLLFTHDPWLDTRWTAKVNSVSNENMNFFKPDHFSGEAHWKQLIGNVTLDASYRISFYQTDKDRISSSKRQTTAFSNTK